MSVIRSFPRAEVIYRGSRNCGQQVELRVVTDPASATMARAWAALTAIHRDVDPHSLEIEIRADRAPLTPAL